MRRPSLTDASAPIAQGRDNPRRGGCDQRRMQMHVLLVVAVLAVAAPAWAQARGLRNPPQRFDDPFSSIRGVRELPDGRVLVADYVENRVAIVDFTRGSSIDVLTDGAGPRNVRLPMGIVALGDSSAVVDAGNSRLVVLGPTGDVVRAQVVERPGRQAVRGLSADGQWLYAIPAWAEGPKALADDSVRVVKWRPKSEQEQNVLVLQGTRYRKDKGPSREPRIPIVGFAGQDAWAVDRDGSIWVVRHAPFRVERLSPDGQWVRGPVQAAPSRPVTLADKQRFVREFASANPTSGRGEGGGMGRTPLPNERQVARQVEITEWAASHPSFDAGGVVVAPGGHLWVRRDADPSRAARYDIFDASGRRLREVALPPGERVVAATARGVYVIHESADGEQHLLRYPWQ